ncbi:CLUMA_CG021322, isoform A [Clunio marinus]|uniref:CLUMA_CG021322, isoform A n=1 Tax=Clunio marinus TaxID=568069 RepID=A0A1J1J7P7_9DIPT|nr:CLUMA_CG021322, isoform A [Clunio marinus]
MAPIRSHEILIKEAEIATLILSGQEVTHSSLIQNKFYVLHQSCDFDTRTRANSFSRSTRSDEIFLHYIQNCS